MPVIQAHATPWTSGAVPELQKIARDLSIAIISGVSEREGAAIYNSQVFIDERGKVVGKYRKTHLFTAAPIEEHKCFSPGDGFTSFAFADLRFGLSICYDLRFPEVYRKLAVENDVNAFLISSAWPFPRIEHFRTLAMARAIENQSYVIVANRVGTDNGISFCGTSAIIDPYGVIIASASQDREELINAELSGDLVNSVRSRMEVFADRRRDLYQ
jgi:omega-amidase